MNSAPSRAGHMPARALMRRVQAMAQPLFNGQDDPHAEWLTLLWGSRFDRQHALALWLRQAGRQAPEAGGMLAELMQGADAFDALAAPTQQRLRLLILRHWARDRFLD